jgi:DNA modification methylase
VKRTPAYDDGKVSLYHGDARDVLPCLTDLRFDLLLTDPSYGQDFGGFRGRKVSVAGDQAHRAIRIAREAFFEASLLAAPDAHVLSFCNPEAWPAFQDALAPYFTLRTPLIWHKARGGMGNLEEDYARDYEVVLFATGTERRAIAGSRDGAVLQGYPPVPSTGRVHPHEKPDALLRHLIRRHCPPGGTVLDIFCGSGNTLRAARAEGRRGIGIELCETHVLASIQQRLQPETLTLFT